MEKKINTSKYARELYTQYATFSNDQMIKNNIYNIIDDPDLLTEGLFQNKKPREFLNDFILKHYPNEMAIKSNFINNILFKEKNHVSIFELKAGKSRVDLCKINGVSTAFEIKTEFDTVSRLHQQMFDYFEIFEKVYLICPEFKVDKMEQYIPNNCGIYTYYITKTGKYRFKKVKTANYSDTLSAKSQLLMLTKKDLNFYFDCPILPDKEEMFNIILKDYSGAKINASFKKCLKGKYSNQWNFLVNYQNEILEIDYQWFFKNQIKPQIMY